MNRVHVDTVEYLIPSVQNTTRACSFCAAGLFLTEVVWLEGYFLALVDILLKYRHSMTLFVIEMRKIAKIFRPLCGFVALSLPGCP